MRRVVRIKAMQGLYTYYNNKTVNLATSRQEAVESLIEIPEFYSATPMEKSGFQALLPVLLDEAFGGTLKTEDLPENQVWLGILALNTVKEWNRENLQVLERIRKEAHLDFHRQAATEVSFWQLFSGLIRQVQTGEERKQNRFLDNEPSPVHELKILSHPFLETLRESLHPGKGSPPPGCFHFDAELQRRLFLSLLGEMPEYQTYRNKPGVSREEEEEIFRILYRKLLRSEEFNEACLEQDLHWSENRVLLEYNLKNTFRKLLAGQTPEFGAGETEPEEMDGFFDTLLDSCIRNFESFEEKIQEVAENWHNDRVALLDKWIIHLSLNEMIAFPHIPVKVTMNEYLEIAKGYSTPGSAGFINGVVDRIARSMEKDGTIRKSARGMMDNR